MWSFLPALGRGGSGPAAGCLSVLRAFSSHWLRGELCGVRPPVPLKLFSCVCLSLNIQSITLAQCMSPKVLQGFHSLGEERETVR